MMALALQAINVQLKIYRNSKERTRPERNKWNLVVLQMRVMANIFAENFSQ